MKVKIEIDGSNAAFFDEDGSIDWFEFSIILQGLSDGFQIDEKDINKIIRDSNGNKCGFIEITE
jgi:Ca2+-binding EF-hand superfamily protein